MILQPGKSERVDRHGHALCIGIGAYPHLVNRNLRYAVADATIIAERLADSQRGNFAVTALTEPAQTTKAAIEQAVEQLLGAPDRQAEDLALLYFSCHGDIDQANHTFCLLPSNASLQGKGMLDPTALISIYDFAQWFANATIQNIVVFLDVCHSGGAGAALQHLTLKLEAGPNFFFIGAARQDRAAYQSSQLEHGLFTNCLLRAFGQPPAKDGWITISQIQNFVDDEMKYFSKNDRPTQIQGSSVFVNPQLPLLRNPGYPELYPLPPLWNVPLQRNVFFTGQEDLLSRLASILQSEQKTALTQPYALSGLGGIGKTQLALEYAYRHRQDYHAVLWGRAESTEALISTFLEIAQVLDLPQMNEPDQTVIVEAVKTWMSHRPQWLFILDNADDVGLVQAFLPPTFRGHLLLTTRAQALGKIVESTLEVEAMRSEKGALLLLRRARIASKETALEEVPDEVVTQAKGLAEELGGLPLALDQAGAYIEVTGCSLADYQQQYQVRRVELLALRNGPAVLPGAWKDDHPESVATTWSLSFARVEHANPLAAELLRGSAFLAPDAIPEELLVEALKTPFPVSEEADDKERGGFSRLTSERPKKPEPVRPEINARQIDEAVTLLRGYSLIQRNALVKTLSIHRLVQVVLRESLPINEQVVWMWRVVDAVSIAFPTSEFANWSIYERLLPHAQRCVNWIEQAQLSSPTATHLLNQAGHYLQDRGRYREAEPLYTRALVIHEQALGPNHPDTAQSLNNLATLYRKQGRYEEAELFLQQAFAILEQQVGTNHPWTATTLNNLAHLYHIQGHYEKAEPLYQWSLAIRERLLGANHPDTATSLNNLASLYDSQSKYREAELLYWRALAIWEQLFGSDHPTTVKGLNNLAMLYYEQKRYGEAEPLLERVLAIRERLLGANHPDTSNSLNNLGNLYHAQGNYEKAEPLLQRALAICEHQLGPDHPNAVQSRNNLAMLYYDQIVGPGEPRQVDQHKIGKERKHDTDN